MINLINIEALFTIQISKSVYVAGIEPKKKKKIRLKTNLYCIQVENIIPGNGPIH